jgi:heptosyltransferase-2
MTREVLIIKLGALGDVLRTTPLLRRLEGRVTWVTTRGAMPLLGGNPRVARLVDIAAAGDLRRRNFALVINFDEDDRACRLAASVKASRKIGARMNAGVKTYCPASAPWFDMSLISRLGRGAADRLKARGRRCYQDYLFQACGLRFQGEEYMLPLQASGVAPRSIALETRVSPRWPAKAWTGFARLAPLLNAEGFVVSRLRRRLRLERYFADINDCGLLVTADTLAMHVALALGKAVVAIFNCTSPHEIFSYGRMEKVINPRLHEAFYSQSPVPGLSGALPVEQVADAVRRAAKKGIAQ